MAKKVLVAFPLVFLFLLTGCGNVPIIHDLVESEANEILVALHDRGIESEKVEVEKNQKISWSVLVAQKDTAAARKVLVENNLPRKRELGFSGICKDKGLIPTPEEEKCRKILALKGEIINSLSRIPGVIESDVVLNIPDISEFATETQASKRPTASAVLRVKKSSDVMGEVTEPKIQRFISNTVENLDPRDVSVVITYIQPPEEILKQAPLQKKLLSIAGLKMDADSKGRFKIYALSVLLLLVAVSVALVFSLLKLTKLRTALKAGGGGGTVTMPMGAEQDPKLIQAEAGAGMPQIPAAGQTVQKT